MLAPEEALEEAAGAILDGTAVDWAALDTSVDPRDADLVQELRLIASLRTASRSAARSDAPPPERWGHLRVLERIGRGAYGEVYRAWDPRLAREVALKLLPAGPGAGQPAFATASAADSPTSAAIDEGRLLARVRHPNVVTIHGAESIDGRIGLWMEFVRGRTLEERLGEGGVFSATEVARLGSDLCRAVAAVHAAGLLHRDIKAQNVMVADDDGRVVLMDFGAGSETRGSARATAAGTPLYLAPEVLSGGAATRQSDVYSIGVLLYHLLTNSYPVAADNLAGLRGAHERGERTDLRSARPDVPPRLARIVERALDPAADRRYATADALAEDLQSVQKSRAFVRAAYAAAVAAILVSVVWIGWGRRATAALPPDETPVIAVLPFKNLSSAPDSDYFADGLTAEIIRSLSMIEGLQVRSHTSSFFFKDKPRNLADISRQLRANLVVDGSVQREGKRLRVQAQLVRVAGDLPLWSENFDRDIADVFAIQDEISRAIVNRLRLTLGRGQRRYETNPEAYERYLHARALMLRERTSGVPGGVTQAVKLFEQVIGSDPSFAPAYAGLADAYAYLSNAFDGIQPNEALAIMQRAAAKALELDPLLAEAHAAMGYVHSRELKWSDAQRSFEKAIELNRTFTDVHFNYVYSTLVPLGKSAYAERLLEAALQVDPLSSALRTQLAMVQMVNGRYEEALANIRQARGSDPAAPFADLLEARALTMAGRIDEALPIWDARKGVGREHWAARAYVEAGRRAEVEQMAARQAAPYQEAMVHAALGDKDRTFDAVNRSVDAWPHRMALILEYPEMALLRGDPRLDAVKKRLRLP